MFSCQSVSAGVVKGLIQDLGMMFQKNPNFFANPIEGYTILVTTSHTHSHY